MKKYSKYLPTMGGDDKYSWGVSWKYEENAWYIIVHLKGANKSQEYETEDVNCIQKLIDLAKKKLAC